MVKKQDRVQWVYAARNNEELSRRYDQWAKDYDSDLTEEFDYQGPQRSGELFARYVPREARVLDAGAGTGLMGEILSRRGYNDLIAMDLSSGMLAEARKKNVYREFHQMALGEPLDFAADSFDAVACIGTLTVAHAPASSFDDLVRVTRPGGYIVFIMRPDVYENNGFKEKQSALEAEGKWQLVEVTDKFQSLPRGEPDIYQQVWVYRVT